MKLLMDTISSVLTAGILLIGWKTMPAAKILVSLGSANTFTKMGQRLINVRARRDKFLTYYQRVLHYTLSIPQEIDSLDSLPSRSLPSISMDSSSSLSSPFSSSSAISPSSSSLYSSSRFPSFSSLSNTSTWPTEGSIEFRDVSFRYRPHLPLALSNISFIIHPHEHIGICGRTGAGKSSLIQPLFRLVELNSLLSPLSLNPQTGVSESVPFNPLPPDDGVSNRGSILIDGIDIASVPLSILRHSLAIIPQDPPLFSGSLRDNLDFLHQRSDAEIWDVLSLLSLTPTFRSHSIHLDSSIGTVNSLFSSGHLQLLSFARALLQKSLVIVMDEPTSTLDNNTVDRIQQIMHNVFSEKTLIVIAHRISTILNMDRVLVMDSGRIAEFDTPKNLMSNPDSLFNTLLSSGS